MPTCKHCRQPIEGEWIRMDAGVTIGAGGPNTERVLRDIDLHDGPCYGAYMDKHYPWAVHSHTRDITPGETDD